MYAVQLDTIEVSQPILDDSSMGTQLVVNGLDWTKARCRDGNGTLTHLFFADELIHVARAKAICAKCPISVACLEGALERQEPWGVWGGELLETGRIVVNKRPRGRPPKHPRPPIEISEDAIALPVRVA